MDNVKSGAIVLPRAEVDGVNAGAEGSSRSRVGSGVRLVSSGATGVDANITVGDRL